MEREITSIFASRRPAFKMRDRDSLQGTVGAMTDAGAHSPAAQALTPSSFPVDRRVCYHFVTAVPEETKMTVLATARGILVLPFLAVLLASAAIAGEQNLTFHGIAIQGYDPVAYFTDRKPIPGDPGITASHDGAIYQFASAEHKAAFDADPARYAPQYGGYCAYAAAQGAKTSIEPEQFTVAGDKLYLNFNADVRQRWLQDQAGYISKADAWWASQYFRRCLSLSPGRRDTRTAQRDRPARHRPAWRPGDRRDRPSA